MGLSATTKKLKESADETSFSQDVKNVLSKEGLKKTGAWAAGAIKSGLKSGIKSGGAFAARRILGDTIGGFVGNKLFGDGDRDSNSLLKQIRDGVRVLGKTNAVVARVLSDEIKLQRENSVDKAINKIAKMFNSRNLKFGETGENGNLTNALNQAHSELLTGSAIQDVIDSVLDSVQAKFAEEHKGAEVPKEILKELTKSIRALAKEAKDQALALSEAELSSDAQEALLKDISNFQKSEDASTIIKYAPGHEPIPQWWHRPENNSPVRESFSPESFAPKREIYRDARGRFAKAPSDLERDEEDSINSEDSKASSYAAEQRAKKPTAEKKSLWQTIIEKFLPMIFKGFAGLKSVFTLGVAGLAQRLLGGRLAGIAESALALGKNALGLGAKAAIGGATVAAEAVAGGTAAAGLLGKGKALMSKVGLTKGGLAGMTLGGVTTFAGEQLEKSGHSVLGDIVKDAGNGAMAGSLVGPWGTLAGAVSGAAYGIYDNWDKITGPSNNRADTIASKSPSVIQSKESPTIINNNTTNNYATKTKNGKSPINQSRNSEPSIQRMTDRAYTPALV